MPAETMNQLQNDIAVFIYAEPVAAVKQCTICNNELVIVPHIHYTSFGLQLCEDCLYL